MIEVPESTAGAGGGREERPTWGPGPLLALGPLSLCDPLRESRAAVSSVWQTGRHNKSASKDESPRTSQSLLGTGQTKAARSAVNSTRAHTQADTHACVHTGISSSRSYQAPS